MIDPEILSAQILAYFSLNGVNEATCDHFAHQLHHRETTDPLTNLRTPVVFDTALQERMTECDRRPDYNHLGVLIGDLDHFKYVNDTWGHEIGDNVLREVGGAILSVVRPEDLPCRIGGEEFGVLISRRGKITENRFRMSLTKVAERLRLRVAKTHKPNDEPVTVSIGGVVYRPGYGLESKVIRSGADAQMYRAKLEGRDRVKIL